MAQNTPGATLVRAIATLIKPDDDAIAALGALFTDDVTVWSPVMLAVGLDDLAENLALRETAFSDVEIEINSVGVVGNKGFAEFVVAATFSGPFVIDEEAAVEPNGRQLLIGAATIADFAGGKIKSVRTYFDDLTLLEQMLAEKV